MKEFHCSDMGLQCDWVAHEETESEIVEKALQHGKEAHDLEPSPEIAEAVRQKIRGEGQES